MQRCYTLNLTVTSKQRKDEKYQDALFCFYFLSSLLSSARVVSILSELIMREGDGSAKVNSGLCFESITREWIVSSIGSIHL